MQSKIFSITTPVFSVTWSFRNHSNFLKKKKEKKERLFLILPKLKTVVLLDIFVETMIP